MKKYFLAKNSSRADSYGIGTYIQQTIYCVKNYMPQYELSIVDLDCDVANFIVRKDNDGVTHYLVPMNKTCNDRILYYRYVLFLLEPYIGNRLDIFHFNHHQHFDLMRLVKEQIPSCRLVYTVHYLDWCFLLNGNVNQFCRIISEKNYEDDVNRKVLNDFIKTQIILALCDNVIVLSKWTYKLLSKYYCISKSKLYLAYNGLFETPITDNTLCGDNKRKEILYVGRLDNIKGIMYLLKAFKQICAADDNVHLTLVGDGDFGAFLPLCQGVWDRVTFTGKISRTILEHFYRNTTIGVQPSFHEQCSYSAIEMMAHGIPLIATDTTGLAEMMDATPENIVRIEDDFHPEAFVYELARKIHYLLYNEKLRKKTSIRQFELYQKRYSPDYLKSTYYTLNGLFSKEIKGFVSKDFLPILDNEMVRLIDERPDIDYDLDGFSGIGCYLWWRILSLSKKRNKDCIWQYTRLQEHMIYYVDWLYDMLIQGNSNSLSISHDIHALQWLLSELHNKGFYKTRIDSILKLINDLGINHDGRRQFRCKKQLFIKCALTIYNLKY